MHAWEAVQKTLNYIEEHISEETEIEELAETAALSPFYYQRLFTRLVKKPVREYIRLRRLARACEAIRNKKSRIIDVAMEYGFSSHEIFTKAFKEAYNITPSQYRDNPVGLINFYKPDLLLDYVMIDEGVPLISDGMVLEFRREAINEPIDFIGVSGILSIEDYGVFGKNPGIDAPGEVWNSYKENSHKMPKKTCGRNIGVWFTDGAPEGSFIYFTGGEAEKGADCGEFETWALPAREYIVCRFEAETFGELTFAGLKKALRYSDSWLTKHGLTAFRLTEKHDWSGMFAAEMFYHDSPESVYMELWVPAVKRAETDKH